MKLFSTQQEHADNPPSTWRVARNGTCRWSLETAGGVVLDTFPTQHDARRARGGSPLTHAYERQAFGYRLGIR